MASLKFTLKTSMSLPAQGQRTRFPHLDKIASDVKLALRDAARAGEEAMKNRVLDSPPTGSKVDDGRRVDTWTMYDSISRSKVKEVKPKDRRRRSGVSVSFGFPADVNGQIKDAPAVPTRGQASDRWRSDPNYFVMQEYGDSMFEELSYPGMFAQNDGAKAAEVAFQAHMRKKGYK